MMSDKLNLYQKLHAIMQEMDNIPKSGTHPKQGWAFHQANDIFNGARAAFIKHRVIVVPGCIPEHTNQIVERVTKSGQRGDYEQINTRTNIVFTYTFIDIDSGEKLETAWPGESVDYDDKGTQQAGTSSMKYMLMKMFLATPDHDPDYNSVETTPSATTDKSTPQPKTTPASNGAKAQPVGEITVTHCKYVNKKDGTGAILLYEQGDTVVLDFSREALRKLGDQWQVVVDEWQSVDREQAEPIKLLSPLTIEFENVFSKDTGELAYRRAVTVRPAVKEAA